MATIAEIQSWLSANPGASDATIAAAMDKYGVSTQQLASAANMNANEVQRRYNAVKTPSQSGMLYNTLSPTSSPPQIVEIQSWLSANPGASDATIAAAMDKYDVSPSQMASVVNMNANEVQRRYTDAKNSESRMLYNSLTPTSSHQQIIDAYNQWAASQGGSTQSTLDKAGDYLRNLGISNEVIGQSYNRFKDAPSLSSLAGSIAQQAQSGDNAGAYATYQQAVNKYGFTPEDFSQAVGGQFSPQQIQQWAAQGAQGAFNQPVRQPPQQAAPSFNYGDFYWNQVGQAYQGMFGGQQGLHVPELKEWYAGQGWNPGQAITQTNPQPMPDAVNALLSRVSQSGGNYNFGSRYNSGEFGGINGMAGDPSNDGMA